MALPRRRTFSIVMYVTIFTALISAYAEDHQEPSTSYQACEPKTCGTGPNISYPFYIRNAGKYDNCGVRGFGIRCEDGKPIYRTSAAHYVVEEIDYSNQTFRVVDQQFIGDGGGVGACSMPLKNYSADRSPVEFSHFHADIVFFYGCNPYTFWISRIVSQSDSERCNSSPTSAASGLRTFVALVPLDEGFQWNRESCRDRVLAPVQLRGQKELNASIKEVDYRKLLRQGFTLDWRSALVSYNCAACQTSGGRCGFRDGQSLCYCADGTSHPTNCFPPNAGMQLVKAGKRTFHSAGMQAVLIVSIAISILFLVIFLPLCLIRRRHRKAAARDRVEKLSYAINPEESVTEMESRRGNSDLPFFHLKEIAAATNNFSDANKLGKGGFGSVYKGTFEGNEIAVKRLSKNSGQGAEEFRNEVQLIAKLQHKNLVRILGCCVEGQERMLVYEYLPNKSLDSFIFDKNAPLDWWIRYSIICGIARGILYLREDSRLKIIHRDLKASNILLDGSMNPKISDFGMARIFGVNQNEDTTKRVVGAYGYMSPEYAMQGVFSIKSDVYSFGVLLLETITGRKNSSYYEEMTFSSLIAYTWELWKQGRAVEIISWRLGDERDVVIRCIHIGLLCVQELATDRPNMFGVVFMLCNMETTPDPPAPKKPAFILNRGYKSACQASNSTTKKGASSINDVTVTVLEAR